LAAKFMAIKENIAETAVAKFVAKPSAAEAQNLLRIAKIFPAKSLIKFAEPLGNAKKKYDLALSKVKSGEATKNVTLDATKIVTDTDTNTKLTNCKELDAYLDHKDNVEINIAFMILNTYTEKATINHKIDFLPKIPTNTITVLMDSSFINTLNHIKLLANTNCDTKRGSVIFLLANFNAVTAALAEIQNSKKDMQTIGILNDTWSKIEQNTQTVYNATSNFSSPSYETALPLHNSIIFQIELNTKFELHLAQLKPDWQSVYKSKLTQINEQKTVLLSNKEEAEKILKANANLIEFRKNQPLNNNTYWSSPDEEPSFPGKAKLKNVKGNLLTKKGKDDANDIDSNDATQGLSGNCYLVASIATIANQNPEFIRNMIEVVPGKDKKEASYIVTLYLRDATDKPIKMRVAVSGKFPNKAGKFEYSQKGDGEIWVMLIEKAYAKVMGGYDNISAGGASGAAIQVLTGIAPTTLLIDASTSDEKILESLKKGATAATKATASLYMNHKTMENKPELIIREISIMPRKSDSANGINITTSEEEIIESVLYLKHVYYFDEIKNNKISLKNPHGKYHLLLDINEFRHYFYKIDLANIPK
jgi:hypothetical protein